MVRQTELIAIHSGGDWYDASAEYIVIPLTVNLCEENILYLQWYKTEYVPGFRGDKPRLNFMNFADWLISKGARLANENDIFVYEES